MKRLISFALYGDAPLYVVGAAENVEIRHRVYPDWTLRFYGPKESRIALEAETTSRDFEWVETPKPIGSELMFTRFEAAADPDAEYILFRDADSRLNVREAACTAEWVRSGRNFCVIRDHPDHAVWPLLGGLWSVKGGVMPDIKVRMDRWKAQRTDWHGKLSDMRWLAEDVWNQCIPSMLHFSSVPTQHGQAQPFPAHSIYTGFCGEIVPVSVECVL